MLQGIEVTKLNPALAIAYGAVVGRLQRIKRNLGLKVANLRGQRGLAIVVIDFASIDDKVSNGQVKDIDRLRSRSLLCLRYIAAPSFINPKMDHRTLKHNFSDINLASPNRYKVQGQTQAIGLEQWRLRI